MTAAAEAQLGERLRAHDFDIGAYLSELFLSEDFYASQGEHIKSPVELVVSTYHKMGLTTVPGVPDFNVVTGALGQRLLHRPRLPDGPRDEAGSHRRCSLSAAILFWMWFFPILILCRLIGFRFLRPRWRGYKSAYAPE